MLIHLQRSSTRTLHKGVLRGTPISISLCIGVTQLCPLSCPLQTCFSKTTSSVTHIAEPASSWQQQQIDAGLCISEFAGQVKAMAWCLSKAAWHFPASAVVTIFICWLSSALDCILRPQKLACKTFLQSVLGTPGIGPATIKTSSNQPCTWTDNFAQMMTTLQGWSGSASFCSLPQIMMQLT